MLPTNLQVRSRSGSLIGRLHGENNFYCSDQCKGSCEIFHKQVHREGEAPKEQREVDPYAIQKCLEDDDYMCQLCHSKENVHAHHIKSYKLNIMLANDVENMITLCKDCHFKIVHKQDGCGFNDLKCR